MLYRERQELIERQTLKQYASFSDSAGQRDYPCEKCDIRTEYQRDGNRILHSKSFRRLKHKTQVFLSPEGDHYRTRLTHTLEVSQIARTISRALRVNEDLTEAIALGHDIGHTPFGHAGERVLNDLAKEIGGFSHNEQSLRVVKYLENDGKGLNLTPEVQDGILNHRTACTPKTIEGKVVRLSDKIAYINHDIDDAISAKVLTLDDLPKEAIKQLGRSHGKRINSMVSDVIYNSEDTGDIIMSSGVWDATNELRTFLFENVYADSTKAKKEEKKAAKMIEALFDYYMENPNEITQDYETSSDVKRIVLDYISGMTDSFAINSFKKIFIPNSFI